MLVFVRLLLWSWCVQTHALSIARGYVKVSDGAQIGYVQSRLPFNEQSRGTVFILPGYTATATQFVDWFAPHFAEAGFETLAMDYRGSGLSTGPWNSSVAPNATTFAGFQISRIAFDAHEVMIHTSVQDPVLMGHSYGVSVAYCLMSLHRLELKGLVVLDQNSRIMSGIELLPVNPTYPSKLYANSTFTLDYVKAQLHQWANFSQAGVYIKPEVGKHVMPILYHYPGVYDVFSSMFKVVLDEPVGDKARGYFCYDDVCLDEWMSGTNYFSEMNGQLVALQMWSDMTQDFTDVAKLVHGQTVYPIFVYGGESSMNPVDSMIWAFDEMHNAERSGDQLLIFERPFGVHVPWLGNNPLREQFYGNLTAWLRSLPATSGDGKLRFSTTTWVILALLGALGMCFLGFVFGRSYGRSDTSASLLAAD
eukprot:TRINITY_DN24011_c0_g1_i1.p1 TRINITY_DN24011_c0_g1~~TRINITY_DN24011_c0_g1_i1.p1  ORF type:complete len:421 (-),score=31.71 TRINITY_DN24011_c0_g1_i1:98-1360(-)